MKICMLANGKKDGIFGRRVRNFCLYTPSLKNVSLFYRDDAHKIFSIFYFVVNIIRIKPEVVYVEAVAFSGCIAVALLKPFLHFKYIISTSDDYYNIIKQLYGSFSGFFANILERLTYRIADAITTLNPQQKEYLISKGYKNVACIENEVDTTKFKPLPVNELRKRLGLADACLTIGMAGSIVWFKKYNYAYGWEIIEIIKILREEPLKGLIVGDGSGLPHLKKLAESYGILDKIIFTGRISFDEIPHYINCMDICFSTQTNNPVGKMRAPIKLGEYLACGKFIISTDVGYAQTLIKDTGLLMPFSGIRDDSYPARAAGEIKKILSDKSILEKGKKGVDIAKERFDPKRLSCQLEELIKELMHG